MAMEYNSTKYLYDLGGKLLGKTWMMYKNINKENQ